MLRHQSRFPAHVSDGCEVLKACTADAALKSTRQSIADKSDMFSDACILVASASNAEEQGVMEGTCVATGSAGTGGKDSWLQE